MNSHFEEKYYRKCFIYIIVLTIREGYYGLKKKKKKKPINPGNKGKYLFFISAPSFPPFPSVSSTLTFFLHTLSHVVSYFSSWNLFAVSRFIIQHIHPIHVIWTCFAVEHEQLLVYLSAVWIVAILSHCLFRKDWPFFPSFLPDRRSSPVSLTWTPNSWQKCVQNNSLIRQNSYTSTEVMPCSRYCVLRKIWTTQKTFINKNHL